MPKLNVGFIGCGRISDLHAPGYKNHPDATLYAVCDTNKELAQQKAGEWKAEKVYTDYQEMLANPTIDAIEVLTPHTLHEKMTIDSLQAGKNVALQKPMTINLKSADRIVAAANKAKGLFKVTDNYLTYPPINLAKKMIDDGEIGTPTNLRIKMIAGGSGGWEVDPATWAWRAAENDAGRGFQTFDHGHHLWAAAWFLLGDIERVSAWIDTIDGIVDSPAAIMWKYKEGVKYGMCEYAFATDLTIPSNYYANDEWIEITGSKGLIVIHQCTGKLSEKVGMSLFKEGSWKHFTDIKTDWGEGFIGATHNFIGAMQGKEKPLLTGEQARRVLAITIAISESSWKRREVYVDELDARFPDEFTKRRIRRELKKLKELKKPTSSQGIERSNSKYAKQAIRLTEALSNRFSAEEAKDWDAEIGLMISLEETDTLFSISIYDQTVSISQGKLPEPATLTARVPAGLWGAILSGKLSLETAFLEGKLVMEGNIEDGLKMKAVFGL